MTTALRGGCHISPACNMTTSAGSRVHGEWEREDKWSARLVLANDSDVMEVPEVELELYVTEYRQEAP